MKDYEAFYRKINAAIGDKTPLKADCGHVCNGACCKGDENTGMRLFPHEPTQLPVRAVEGGRLVVCNGTCDRALRPLACRIFPFFPTVDERGHVFVEADSRAQRLCPLITHSDEIVFDRRFFSALKRVGKMLVKDEECKAFLTEVTAEIDTYRAFLGENES